MESKYTHKFIIYNKKRIKNNYKGLIEKLANFDKEAIPKDFLENLNDSSEIFLKTQSTTKNTNILITKYGTISLHIDINFIGNSSFTE